MPNSPQKLSETWAGLLSDPDKLEQLSRAGHEGTKANFDIHAKAKETIELYESLKVRPRSL
jgi:hypothetical protein